MEVVTTSPPRGRERTAALVQFKPANAAAAMVPDGVVCVCVWLWPLAARAEAVLVGDKRCTG